jgi:PEP-CTERM motif
MLSQTNGIRDRFIHPLHMFAAALLMMGALALPAQADTITSSGTVTGISTLTGTANPAVFDSNFIGAGLDTVSGYFIAANAGTTTFTSLTMFTASGTFTNVFAGGTLFGTFTESGTVTGTNTSTETIHAVITGGTGMFAGDTGQSTNTGTSRVTSPTTALFTGSYTSSIMTVPEPSSLALMLAGIGLLPLMRKRLARGRQTA